VNTVVAVDTIGAGVGEMVLFLPGQFPPRLAGGMKDAPVDAVIIGHCSIAWMCSERDLQRETINQIRNRMPKSETNREARIRCVALAERLLLRGLPYFGFLSAFGFRPSIFQYECNE